MKKFEQYVLTLHCLLSQYTVWKNRPQIISFFLSRILWSEIIFVLRTEEYSLEGFRTLSSWRAWVRSDKRELRQFEVRVELYTKVGETLFGVKLKLKVRIRYCNV